MPTTGSSCRSELYLVGSGVSRLLAAGCLHVDLLICACKGIWIPRYVGVRGVGDSRTVRATYVVEHVDHPLTIDQLRSAISSPGSYVDASITAGIDVPIGLSGLASWVGLGEDVVAAHRGSGGCGCSCCSGSYGGEDRGRGNRARDVHFFSPLGQIFDLLERDLALQPSGPTHPGCRLGASAGVDYRFSSVNWHKSV